MKGSGLRCLQLDNTFETVNKLKTTSNCCVAITIGRRGLRCNQFWVRDKTDVRGKSVKLEFWRIIVFRATDGAA